MRDHLLLYINGCRQPVTGSDCFLSLSDFLRLRLGLAGTKIVCSEGDCGSCTVLVGRVAAATNRFDYRPVDSCIQWMFQLDGTHIVTVEGLAGSSPPLQVEEPPWRGGVRGGSDGNGRLTPVQEAMVHCHGSQCGFCTPGFVVAMTGLLEGATGSASAVKGSLTEHEWRTGLTGNLCRCTGYVPILEAGRSLDAGAARGLNEIYPPAAMLSDVATIAAEPIAVHAQHGPRTRQFFGPTSLAEAVQILRDNPGAKVVAGATDVGVQLNKCVIDPDVFLDLNRIAELAGAAIENVPLPFREGQGEGSEFRSFSPSPNLSPEGRGAVLVAGARATWTEIESLCRDAVPQFHNIVSVFGSPQIRHVGTLGGNIINASPIADSLPFLFIAEAELELVSAAGTRTVPINDFYQGYKKFDLRPGELLTRLRVPLPDPGDLLRLVKVSRRRDLDIATFTAAIWMRLDGDTIADARVAFGAVGPTVIRARRTEAFLRGQQFDENTMRQAGDIAASEISPISDVRGSAEYRYQLTRNVLLKFYHEQAPAAV